MEKQQLKAVFTDIDTEKELILSIDYYKETHEYDVNISSNPKESFIKMLKNNEINAVLVGQFLTSLGKINSVK